MNSAKAAELSADLYHESAVGLELQQPGRMWISLQSYETLSSEASLLVVQLPGIDT
jgi:hypothetical protein